MMKIEASIIMVTLLLGLTACRNHDTNPQLENGPAMVKVNISDAEFENVNDMDPQALMRGYFPQEKIQKQELQVGKDLTVLAKLSPVSKQDGSPGLQKSVKGSAKAEDVEQGVWYKVAVYNADSGLYVVEKNYKKGSEAQVEGFRLSGGVNYTFIVYSVNTQNEADLPKIVFSDVNNKTLAGSTIKANGNIDFLYHKQNFIPSGNEGADNSLNIVLRHKYSSITVILDITALNFPFGSIGTSYFDNVHYPDATFRLSDGTAQYSGTAGKSSNLFFSFSADRRKATSGSILINGDTDGASLQVPTTINGLTQTIKINNLKIKPGIKYTLNFNFINNEGSLIYEGQSAVRINGTIWMRHNLGADITTDPDDLTNATKLKGGYYKWGNKSAIFWPNVNEAIWNSISEGANGNSWNIGTVDKPLKNESNDPCPLGYRIPSKSEVQDMLTGTTSTRTPYMGVTLTSKKNANAKLSLLAGGSISGSNYALLNSHIISIWDNSPRTGMFLSALYWDTTSNSSYMFSTPYNVAINVRCVAE